MFAMLKDYKVDKLRVRVFETRKEMGDCSGGEAAARLAELLKTKETVNIMFGAAPSQNEMLEAMCAADIDWSRVNAFHMDEYVALDPAHPAGFGNFLRRAIFDKLPFKSVHFINGNAADMEAECERYSALLKEYPLDICMLGVGENGHVAFNDPPVAEFEAPALVKEVELEAPCRQQQVNDGCFESLDQVPTHALTVTVPGLMSADWLYCTVPAPTKADAIKAMLEGPITTDCPASVLRRYENAGLYLDKDAAAKLDVMAE